MINVLKQKSKCWRYGPWILNWTEKCRQQTKTKMKGRLNNRRASRFRLGIMGGYCYQITFTTLQNRNKYFSKSPLKTSQTVIKSSNIIQALKPGKGNQFQNGIIQRTSYKMLPSLNTLKPIKSLNLNYMKIIFTITIFTVKNSTQWSIS